MEVRRRNFLPTGRGTVGLGIYPSPVSDSPTRCQVEIQQRQLVNPERSLHCERPTSSKGMTGGSPSYLDTPLTRAPAFPTNYSRRSSASSPTPKPRGPAAPTSALVCSAKEPTASERIWTHVVISTPATLQKFIDCSNASTSRSERATLVRILEVELGEDVSVFPEGFELLVPRLRGLRAFSPPQITSVAAAAVLLSLYPDLVVLDIPPPMFAHAVISGSANGGAEDVDVVLSRAVDVAAVARGAGRLKCLRLEYGILLAPHHLVNWEGNSVRGSLTDFEVSNARRPLSSDGTIMGSIGDFELRLPIPSAAGRLPRCSTSIALPFADTPRSSTDTGPLPSSRMPNQPLVAYLFPELLQQVFQDLPNSRGASANLRIWTLVVLRSPGALQRFMDCARVHPREPAVAVSYTINSFTTGGAFCATMVAFITQLQGLRELLDVDWSAMDSMDGGPSVPVIAAFVSSCPELIALDIPIPPNACDTRKLGEDEVEDLNLALTHGANLDVMKRGIGALKRLRLMGPLYEPVDIRFFNLRLRSVRAPLVELRVIFLKLDAGPFIFPHILK
ncbi:hypothetical protein BDK51DRAFT_51384 [Blyttiomyces helicus]|uniref:Uncharacterized protein n=1 Tax=Blyttiomyces helicus TaxID=388810 RepID=A0A4P9WMV0_9FUNG|nr:hypothetical protein BDK51DRAFT_51384 [Blyttiomyces helicus]|eukprot:RKO93822.1 hypothetical protein BDK51DRAFT_51384 [Blyttiomyces helicus]